MPKILKDEIIYRTVVKEVCERGYSGATTKQMAEAANVSEMTLYRKYGSKLQLVKQAMLCIVENSHLDSAIRYTGDVYSDLIRILHAYQESAISNEQLIITLFAELPRHPELKDLLDIPIKIHMQIGNLLAKYQSEGVLKHEHPYHSVSALLGPLIYSSMMRNSITDNIIPPIEIQSHVKLYLEGRLIITD